LVQGLRRLGCAAEVLRPKVQLPVFTATRVLFNEALRSHKFHADATIGIDADGYSIAAGRKSSPHVACIKGVLADAVRFERGFTRAAMVFHSRLEAKHARRADLVITTSRYCAGRIEEFYGVKGAIVVPELIDLDAWRTLFLSNPATPDNDRFTVLAVCRFYRRKALDILLRAASQLRHTIPRFEVRIVGNGPEQGRLWRVCTELGLEGIVSWVGDVSLAKLAEEYNRADVFCLPSLQEGFGIVFLEAMAAGKPIIAVQAAAVPEVVHHGILVEPESAESLAEAIVRLYRNPDLRRSLALAGCRGVEKFEVRHVARLFLSEVAKVAPGIAGLSSNNLSGHPREVLNGG
jgi:glycosyltransferase involved in cell wall biosynthesis